MAAKTYFKIKYSLWKDEFKPFLKTLKDKKIILLFSGGKDSSLALDLVLRASYEFDFSFESHVGAFPVHRYTKAERKKINSYWKDRGIEILWHDLAKTDQLLNDTDNPCLLCQKMRKELMKTMLPGMIDNWEQLILIASYSLWDIVSYSVEHILSDIFSGMKGNKEGSDSKRFMETAQRFYPLLKMKEGYSVFRPLIKYNGNDIVNYILNEEIPTISIPCLYKGYRPKRVLEKYYEKMGLRFSYKHVFDFAKDSLGLPAKEFYDSMDKEIYLKEIF
jgi:tRNA(Ile)-lysidine synthase TilS/MesJ